MGKNHNLATEAMNNRNEPCWCSSGKKWKKCHFPIAAPKTFLSPDQLRKEYQKRYNILIKTKEQIAGIRASWQLAATILDKVCEKAKAGVTTLELNEYANKLHKEAGAIPAPLGYGDPPFPKSICTSLNDVICHGIPDNTVLKEGDILNIDVTCILNNYYGDCSRMVMVGNVSSEKELVTKVAYESLMLACEILKPELPLNQIGEVITTHAEKHGCSVVDQFVGHGVGVKFHEKPDVFHSRNSLAIPLKPGMIFTIEPMINAGKKQAQIDPFDEWTATTIDGKPSAQWEHTVLITESGYEILTPWKADL
jgi:methionyl aminopeptidase